MTKATRGRPTKYRPDFHPADYIARAKKGETFVEIACAWDVDIDTIAEWRKKHKVFSGAVQKGRAHLEAWFTKMGKAKMTGQVKGSDTVYIWLTKNLIGWRDRIELDNSGDFEGLDFENR